MALLDDALKGWGQTILLGVGVTLAAPILLPAAAAAFRPLAKALIKGYFALADAMKGGKEVAEEAVKESVVEELEKVAIEVGEELIESAG